MLPSTLYIMSHIHLQSLPGRVAQSVTCLATDACLAAIPGVASSIPARSHTFVEIDHEIISTVILLISADSFKKGCCQLQAKVCARITGYPLVQACPGKSVVRWTDRPAMTIAVDLGRKATKQTKTCKVSSCYVQQFRRCIYQKYFIISYYHTKCCPVPSTSYDLCTFKVWSC